ncbi:MAG: phospholipase D family protein [Candidatus Homeothermus sp.]|nr:phospholipase D family protein [Candidatus Homeothermus sp.]
MRLLISSEELQDAFATNIKDYDKFYCCVAWAGAPSSFPIGKLLIKKSDRIEKAIVGLHFYQTHPDFIKTFIDHKGIRFIKETDGIFHDKIYLFVNSSKDWVAITGSSNLTNGGFIKNIECNVLFSNEDDKDGKMYKSLIDHIELNWRKASSFTTEDLNNYMDSFNQQKPRRDVLKKVIRSTKHSFNGASLLLMTWEEYCAKLQHHEGLTKRLNVLKEAHALFKSTNHFYELDEFDKKKISGYRLKEAEDWWFFGTVSKGEILSEMVDKRIGRAIDCIPLDGEVSRSQYDKYVQLFCDGEKWNNPIGSATRLLAMKRPDIFLCVNGENRAGLAHGLGIPQSQITLENYWDEIVVPIQNAAWYNGIPKNIKQREIFKNRVALLDSIYYD